MAGRQPVRVLVGAMNVGYSRSSANLVWIGNNGRRICRKISQIILRPGACHMTTIEDLTRPHFALVAGWISKPEINRWLTAEWRGKVATGALVAMMSRNKKNRVFLVRWENQPVALAALANIDSADAT